MQVDYDGAISVLAEYKRLIDECDQTAWLSKDRKAALERLNAHALAANRVLNQCGLSAISGTTLSSHRQSVAVIDRALALLTSSRTMAQVAEQLGHPALPMSMLHPIVRQAARPLWDKGNYRHAVADAATNVTSFTQRRLRRYDISDRELMAQAFSEKEPEKGKARLRCPGTRNSETVKSLQEGAKLFAMGTFQAVRNIPSIASSLPPLSYEEVTP